MNRKNSVRYDYWSVVWRQFKQRPLGLMGLIVVSIFCLVGVYAPFLASGKPLVAYFEGSWYFPLFRYLFYRGYFSKPLDLFFNLLIFTLPIFVFTFSLLKHKRKQRMIALGMLTLIHLSLFAYLCLRTPNNPASDPEQILSEQMNRQVLLNKEKDDPILTPVRIPDWNNTLSYMNDYAKLNLLLNFKLKKSQYRRMKKYEPAYEKEMKKKGLNYQTSMPILWNYDLNNEEADKNRHIQTLLQYEAEYPAVKTWISFLEKKCQFDRKSSIPITCDFLKKLSERDTRSIIQSKDIVRKYELAKAKLQYIDHKRVWLEENSRKLRYVVMPLLRSFHWEEDAGGSRELNRHIDWWDLTRINRKDMLAALIFGVRISLSVGLTSIGLALLIGIPVGAFSGFYGGKIDMVSYRMIEIWESMPTFFMLLMIVAFLQSKSILIVVTVIGLFGWTGFSRFIRGEFLRQKQLPYIESCRAMGFNDSYIMFSHILPNAIPPLLTLIPFAVMGAITSEAGLSFLGLGEEGSGSWGVLMDEGRTAFPAESYLLWPPAILLTIFLISIALMGDALRDSLDPKLHRIA